MCIRDRLYNGATAGCEELNDNGYYTITVGNVDTDDPNSGADITPFFTFNNTAQVITNHNNTVYETQGDSNYNVTSTWLTIGSEANTNGTLDKVFWIFDTITEGFDFFNDDLGYTPEQVTIWYQDNKYLGPKGGAYYCFGTTCYNYTSPSTIVLTGAMNATEQHEELSLIHISEPTRPY